MDLSKRDIEDFVGRMEKAVAGARGSLSPALVAEWDKHIRQIPVLAQEIKDIRSDSDRVGGVVTELAVVRNDVSRHTSIIDSVFRWIWGMLAGIFTLGAGLIASVVFK